MTAERPLQTSSVEIATKKGQAIVYFFPEEVDEAVMRYYCPWLGFSVSVSKTMPKAQAKHLFDAALVSYLLHLGSVQNPESSYVPLQSRIEKVIELSTIVFDRDTCLDVLSFKSAKKGDILELKRMMATENLGIMN